MVMDWLPSQRRFIRAVENPKWDTCVLSCPRAFGKTEIAGYLIARSLTPGDKLYSSGGEVPLFAGSIEQCRLSYRAAIRRLEDQNRLDEFRLVDSATRLGITRKDCKTRVKAIGSNPKTSLGLGVENPLVIIDEPSALHEIAGADLWDSISTANSKPGSVPMKTIITGTLAPGVESGWYRSLVNGGTSGSTYIQLLQGRRNRWDQWSECLRVNPLAKHFPKFRARLREEFEEALKDPRLKARFLSYRLNCPSADESEMVLNIDDWDLALARPVAEPDGDPIVGVDLGAGRAFSAAVAVWQNGRVEAIALMPGVPDVAAIERRDRAPSSTYQKLIDDGNLEVDHDKRVQRVEVFARMIEDRWPDATKIVCDRFRAG